MECGSCQRASVCVVITRYKQPSLLAEAVMSALGQTVPCGIVLVNDGCPFEETDAFCLWIRSVYPERVLYLDKRNAGSASARNAGIDLELFAGRLLRRFSSLMGTIGSLQEPWSAGAIRWPSPAPTGCFRVWRHSARAAFLGIAGEYSRLEHILQNYVDTSSLRTRRVVDSGVQFAPEFPLTRIGISG
jgi:hypothetical protein